MKALVSGAVVALASGLLMGAALKPSLQDDDRPAGPQILAGFAGERPSGPFDDGATLASYKGKLPDYVLGTDFNRSASIFPTADAPPPVKMAANDAPAPDLAAIKTADDDPPVVGDDEDMPPQPSFPSVDGGSDAATTAHAQPSNSTADQPAVG